MKKILLLTSYYPYKKGDGSFLINEIDALSKAFDKVYIARQHKLQGVDEYKLPSNVEIAFGGFSNRKDFLIKGLFNLSKVPFKIFLQDYREINSLHSFSRFLFAFLLGRSLYSNKKIKYITADKNTVVYSFWGMGMSYVIPFLSHDINKIIVKLHRGDLYENYAGYIPFRRSIYSKVDKIVTISEDGKNYVSNFLKENDIETNKVHLVRLGTKFHHKCLNLDITEGKLVVSCSNLIGVKRVDLIYKVLFEASKKTKLRWVHFGDGPLKESIMNEIEQTENLIVEFRGNQPNEAIMKFYKKTKIDLFINLSSSEGIPVSIMEAISFDIPVLATNAGGTGEIVHEKYKTGILVDNDFNCEKITSKILYMLYSPEKFKPHEFWIEHYNRDINNRKLIGLLKNE